MQFVYDDQLRAFIDAGDAVIIRVSYVEPKGTQWTADMNPLGGPVLGPFGCRADALQAEREWLKANLNL